MGSTRSDLLSSTSSRACTLSCPVWVMKAKPLMPMISPMSSSFLKTVLYRVLSSPGQISSRFTYTWMRPVASWSSIKEAAPMMRRDMMRPAMQTSCRFPFSGSYFSAIPRAVSLTGYKAAGYGSIPNSLIFARDSRRKISCSLRSMFAIKFFYTGLQFCKGTKKLLFLSD